MSDGTHNRARPAWIIAAASFGFAVVQLDVTVVNVALPQVGTSLAAGTAALQWVVDGYTLSFAALLLSAGVLADRIGARRAYLLGFALFTLASIACGLAQDARQLVAARVAQGAGAAPRAAGRWRALRAAPSAHTGRLTRKMLRHPSAASSAAPTIGPAAIDTPPAAVHTPTARARRAASLPNAWFRTASEAGTSSAAPAPCATRAATSCRAPGARPQAIEASVKSAKPRR